MENPLEENRVRYNRMRNKVRKLSRNKRKNLEQSIDRNAKHNPKAVWKYINAKAKVNHKIVNIMNSAGELQSDEQEITNIFNKFFASVYTVESDPPPNIPLITRHKLGHIEFHETEILSALLELKVDKPPGPDGIHPKFLSEVAHLISKPLTYLFNLSMLSGTVPNYWKIAQVSPIH